MYFIFWIKLSEYPGLFGCRTRMDALKNQVGRLICLLYNVICKFTGYIFEKSGEMKVTRQLCKETSWIQGLAPKYSDYGYSGGSMGEPRGP